MVWFAICCALLSMSVGWNRRSSQRPAVFALSEIASGRGHRTSYSRQLNRLQSIPKTADAGEGATSKEKLQELYGRYFDQHNPTKLGALAYWPGVKERERDAFFRSVGFDLKYRLLTVEITPLDRHIPLEYSVDGVVFRPALPPVCRLVAKYQGNAETANFSTSYIVGQKDGTYYIDLAVPVTASH